MTTPFSSAASITISWSTRKIASATRPYWAHCRRSSTGTSTSPWIKNASLGPTSSRPDPAYASASPPCPAPCTSPSTTCTATIPSQVIPMGPPSTISEPDSGMHSLTDSVCGCGVGQPVSPANLELLHFLWGRLSTCRRLSAGAHVGQASTPAAGLQTRNVGQASTPAAGLQTRNVEQAVSPAKHNHQPPAGVPSGSHQPRRAMLAFALALLLAPIAHAASIPSFSILSDDQGGWPLLLQSVGFMPQPAASARIFVLRAGSAVSPEWPARVETGAYLILEGESSTAETFGFRATKENVKITSLEDVHLPKLPIVWEKGLEPCRLHLIGPHEERGVVFHHVPQQRLVGIG